MFSGIISDIGRVVAIDKLASSSADVSDWRITIASGLPAEKCRLGASVACNGVCLTIAELVRADGAVNVNSADGADASSSSSSDAPLQFMVQAGLTTRARTTVASWREGMRLNLEGSLSLGDTIDGHLVMGHVDGCVRLTSREEHENELRLGFELTPETLQRLDEDSATMLVARGSVALDGVSLTIATCERAGRQGRVSGFSLSIVPYTAQHTTLAELNTGDWANIELDMLARYVAARTNLYESS